MNKIMNLSPKQIAEIAHLYAEYIVREASLRISGASASRRKSSQQFVEEIENFLDDFIPRYKKAVPIEIQRALGTKADELEAMVKRELGE